MQIIEMSITQEENITLATKSDGVRMVRCLNNSKETHLKIMQYQTYSIKVPCQIEPHIQRCVVLGDCYQQPKIKPKGEIFGFYS